MWTRVSFARNVGIFISENKRSRIRLPIFVDRVNIGTRLDDSAHNFPNLLTTVTKFLNGKFRQRDLYLIIISGNEQRMPLLGKIVEKNDRVKKKNKRR